MFNAEDGKDDGDLRCGHNPDWGCGLFGIEPKVAPSSQPWALRRNPVGIRRRGSEE